LLHHGIGGGLDRYWPVAMNEPVGAPQSRALVAFLGLALSRPSFRHALDKPDDGLARRSRQAHTRFPSVEIVNPRAREVQEGDDRLSRARPLLRENGAEAFVEGPKTAERIAADGHAPIDPGDDPPTVVPVGTIAKGCFGEIGHPVIFDFGSLVAKDSDATPMLSNLARKCSAPMSPRSRGLIGRLCRRISPRRVPTRRRWSKLCEWLASKKI
jgi:hypothetical protein